MFLVTLFGWAAMAIFASKIVPLVWQLLRPAKALESFGTWTVITGATDGIGQAMAKELAKKGQSLLIIGRNQDKLNTTVEAIQKKYPKIEVEALQIDLSTLHGDKALQQRYCDVIASKDVGILINNAGLAYTYTNYFDEVEQQRVEDMIYVNNVSPTILMQLTIKNKFLAKKKGSIVNISSAGSIVPHPFHVVYSATKAYLNKISADLASEYSSKGITVQSQMPYFVVTKMSKQKRATATIPSPEQYADAAVRQIGYNGVLSPFPAHALIFFCFEFIPSFLLNKFVYDLHFKIKKKGDKKYNKSE